MKNKKIISILLIAVITAGLFAGCGSKNVFPVSYEFGDTKLTITGYEISKDTDGNPTIKIQGENLFKAFFVDFKEGVMESVSNDDISKSNMIVYLINCEFETGGITYTGIDGQLSDDFNVLFSFDSPNIVPKKVIITTNAEQEEEKEVIISFKV